MRNRLADLQVERAADRHPADDRRQRPGTAPTSVLSVVLRLSGV